MSRAPARLQGIGGRRVAAPIPSTILTCLSVTIGKARLSNRVATVSPTGRPMAARYPRPDVA
jgi:hypothetical protein